MTENLGKKLASKARTEDTLIISKYEDHYWITNTHWAIRLYDWQYHEFRRKYNSYKSTNNIPKIEDGFNGLGMRSGDGFKEHDSDLMDFFCNREPSITEQNTIKLIPFYTEGNNGNMLQIISRNGELGAIQKRYRWLIEEFENCFVVADGPDTPIYIVGNGSGPVALIMPVRMSDSKLRSMIETEMLSA